MKMICCGHTCRLIIFIWVLTNSYINCKGVISKGGAPKSGNNNRQKQGNNFGGISGDNGFNDGFTNYNIDVNYLRSEESFLRANLMANYTYDVRPVVNASTVTYVNITLTIIQIMDLDEQNQVMITNAQIALKWKDEHLIWDPELYDNQSRLVLSSKDIWTPDIVLFNSADVAYSTQRDNYLIDVAADGTVTWMFPDILRSYCRVDIKYFPFDRQNCTLELQSWARNKKEVYVFHDENPYMNHSFINTEWRLLNINVQPGEQNNFVWLEFTLYLKRNHAFYVNHMIFPFTILSSLTLFVFWLPPDSGEKITLTITILLALTVFLQLITEYTPKAAKTLPIIGLYFNINLILVLVSVILTIIVLNFHFRGPKKQRVPRWMRHFLIGYMGRAFCFCYESRAYRQAQKDFQKEPPYTAKAPVITLSNRKNNPTLLKSCSQVQHHKQNEVNNESDNDQNDFENQIEPAYVKVSKIERSGLKKENHIVLDYSNDSGLLLPGNLPNKQEILSKYCNHNHGFNTLPAKHHNCQLTANSMITENTNKSNNLNILNNCNFNSSNQLHQELPFNEDISKNLERMLTKMQKSFDPFKLKDDNLKFSIVKEILECQRLLLTVNLTNNANKNNNNTDSSGFEMESNYKNDDLSITEIYDEWKILAMIVDRICFFIYLLALVFSSGIFFLRDYIYNDETD